MKRTILAKLVLMTIFVLGVNAQEFDVSVDQDCNPLVVPPKCQAIRQKIKAAIERMDSNISQFEKRLKDAGPDMKAQLIRIIRGLRERREQQLKEFETEYKNCLSDAGATPRQLAANELTSSFTGTAVLTINDENTPDPFSVPIDIDLRFTRSRCGVTITRFPKLTLRTKSLPVIGRITVEVTKSGGGAGVFHPVSGTMSIPITLHIHYDTALLSDDDATFNLTTGNSVSRSGTYNVTGAPLSRGGSITLVGTTRFQNGYLERKEGSLVIAASISPHP